MGVSLLALSACGNTKKVNATAEGIPNPANTDSVAPMPQEPFQIDNYSDERTVDYDGLECNFTFNIDWPLSGNPQLIESIRSWITETILGRSADCTSGEQLAEAVVDADGDSGNISKDVSVSISEEGSDIKVETSVSWSAGFSPHSPMGRTTAMATFNPSDGTIISQDIVREGDDN